MKRDRRTFLLLYGTSGKVLEARRLEETHMIRPRPKRMLSANKDAW
jgi:hypothetical protein